MNISCTPNFINATFHSLFIFQSKIVPWQQEDQTLFCYIDAISLILHPFQYSPNLYLCKMRIRHYRSIKPNHFIFVMFFPEYKFATYAPSTLKYCTHLRSKVVHISSRDSVMWGCFTGIWVIILNTHLQHELEHFYRSSPKHI